ncbi:MAG: hypothetical protein ACOYVF_00580 [Candidatus Zixiibacteriota bacterium]
MKKLFLFFTLIVVVAGCGRRDRITEETVTPQVYYETAWIDPRIMISDSLFTLIRSERIDSFIVEAPVPEPEGTTSVSFEVSGSGCPVVVNILDEKSARVFKPLLVKELPAGFYKLSLNTAMVSFRTLPPGYYVLKVDNCGQPVMKLFTRQ